MKSNSLKIWILFGLLQAAGMMVSSFNSLQAQAGGWLPQVSSTTQNLYGVAFSDPQTWIAVGEGGTIVRSIDGGQGWTTISSPVGDALRGVAFNGKLGLAVGIGGRLLRTTDGGLDWDNQARPTKKALYSASIGDGFAVITGEEGGIFVSTDDGVTWKQHLAGTASILFGVSAKGALAVGVGGLGAIVNSDNYGAGWGLQVQGGALTFFYGTSFVNETTGWAVGTSSQIGSLIIRSDLSGFTWTLQTAPTSEELFGVSFASIDTGVAVGTNGAILHTTDGGSHWSTQPSGVTARLNAVCLADPRLGIAVGDGGTILRSSSTSPIFRRGDANSDGVADLSDAISILFHLFQEVGISCEKAADSNDDGAVDLSDIVFLLDFLFLGGTALNEPLGSCGVDPTPDELPCDGFPACE